MLRAHFSSRVIRWISVIIASGLGIIVFSARILAQTAEFTQGNKSSSAVTVDVSLGSYPGRGVSLPINLHYSTQGLWRIGFMNLAYNSSYQVSQSVAEAIYAEHSTAGWKTSLDVPKLEWPKVNDLYWANGKPYAYGWHQGYTFRVRRVWVHMPDGSTHELRSADAVQADQSVQMNGTFYAVDGSRMRYDGNADGTGTLYLTDGTRYILNTSTTQYVDRNGNTLNYNATNRQWTDTMGRVISMPWPENPGAGDYTYSLPGINGSSIIYTLKFRNLSSALSPGADPRLPIANYYLPNPSLPPSASNFPQPTGGSTMFVSYFDDQNEPPDPRLTTYVVGRGQSGATAFDPIVLTEIDLPNGQSYRFSYNKFGEIDKVIYPTGGYQRYQLGPVAMIGSLATGPGPYGQGSRGMLSRWISPSGSGSDEAQWTYSAAINPRIVTAPDSTGAPNGTRSETYLYQPPAVEKNFGYEDARMGMPVEERIYAPASQGGAMLRRTLIDYGQTSGIYNKPVQQYYPGTYTAYRNARPEKTVSLILDTGGNALASATTTTYDGTFQFTVGLDAIASSEYAFATVDQTTAQTASIASIPTGALERTTQTSFLTSDANYRNRNILGLASSVTILNAASQIVAQSTISYDEPSYPLLTYGSVNGWIDPQTTYRGNVTTTSRWLDYPASTWITTQAQYDQCGNVRITTDARGNQSQVSYLDSFSDSINRNSLAFPTQTTSAVPDPTGTHGSAVPLVASSVYDFNTGLVTSTTDANNQTMTFEYNDVLNRPTKVNRPDGGWTMTEYSDAPGNIYVHTQTLQRTSPSQQTIEAYQFFDPMGRASRAFAKEGTTYITTDTQYDNLGRLWRLSTPYRTNGFTDPINPSGNWTTSTYDALSRVVAVTNTADGAQVSTVYSGVTTGSYIGPSVTVTDAAGKRRKSTSDAQGRVIQVIEDPNGVAYETNYTYDVLNNLRKVEQGSQLRYFGYDSLSRVIRVRHVEQTVNTGVNWTDPITGNTGWTTALSYDAAGNVASRVDSRNITTSFTYDGLNRATVVLYRINGQPDPNTGDIEYLYDNATNGKGRPWITYRWGSQSFQTAVGSYDAVGHVTQIHRLFGNGQGGWYPAYTVNAGYDFAGHMVSETYPSGHTVSYGYDTAGRLNSFSGTLGDGTQHTYSTAVTYSPFGMEQEQFGTDTPLYHKQRYNVRGQLWDMRASTVPFATDPANGDRGAIVNYYSTNFVQGGSGADNNGNLLRQETYIPGSSFFQDNFAYDSLSRLTSITEKLNGAGADSFKQAYLYDRWGNRTIDQVNTTANVPKPNFGVDMATNRLTAPAGYAMAYDQAGNLTNDTYTGQGTRTYDAENRMIGAQASSPASYVYDGVGQRIKRIVNGTETWQVYGIGGELLAEYAANAAPSTPLKEYGYRNGELLITAEPGAPAVIFSDDFNDNYLSPANWTPYYTPGSPTISEQNQQLQFTLAPNTASYNGVQSTSTYDLTGRAFQVEVVQPVSQGGWVENQMLAVLDGNNYFLINVGAGSILFRSLVGGVNDQTVINYDGSSMRFWRIRHEQSTNTIKFETSSDANAWTIRKSVTVSFSITSLRFHLVAGAWGTGNGAPGVAKYDNVKLLIPATTTSVTVPNSGFETPSLGSGNFQYSPTGGSWTFANGGGISGNNSPFTGVPSAAPEGVQVAFIQATGTISQSVSGFQANTTYTVTFSAIQRTNCCNTTGQDIGVYIDDIPLGSFHPGSAGYLDYSTPVFTTSAGAHTIKFAGLNYNGDQTAFIDNVRISGTPLPGNGIHWLVADQLGTPRMVFDQTGSLANVSRHDYLPFGEELAAGTGGRTTAQGYSANDGVRQHFTGYERDSESGLDYAHARYYSNQQGRFTSVDPLGKSASVLNPQSFNRYSYVNNNPTNFVDPTGMMLSDIGVYQTENPAVANVLERTMVRLFQQAINPPQAPAAGLAAGAAAGIAAGVQSSSSQSTPSSPQHSQQNQLIFIEGAVGTNGTSPFSGLKVYDPVPELMNSTDQGDRLFGYLMKSGFLYYVDQITDYLDKDKKVNFSFGQLRDPLGAIDFLEHNPLFRTGKLGGKHITELGERGNGDVLDARSIQGKNGLGKLSLQINIGKTMGRARADLDQENPYQDPLKFLKHGIRVIF